MKFLFIIGVAVLWSLPFSPGRANVKLPALFSDHMVLQQNQAVPVWGWADPGETVTVALPGQSKTAVADGQGNWNLALAPLKPGDPLTLTVTGKNTITIQDVVVGEVWLASGQSNMEYRMNWNAAYNAPDIAAAENPQVRAFNVPAKATSTLEKDANAKWLKADPQTVRDFSAVAYYFASNLQKTLGVPVGIILSAYGGTQGESWVSKGALDTDPFLHQLADDQIKAMIQAGGQIQAFPGSIDAWIVRHKQTDTGNAGLAQGWAKTDFDDSGWPIVHAPSHFLDYELNGAAVVWYRKSVDLSANVPDKDFFNLSCNLPGVLKVYFNGNELTEIGTPQVRFGAAQHTFFVPKSFFLTGKPNLIAVRQYSINPSDQFGLHTAELNVPVVDPNALTDDWRYQVEQRFPGINKDELVSFPVFPTCVMQNTASYLFNAMINPLIPYGIKGTIWYQGESNAGLGRPLTYEPLLALLIKDWRQHWGEGDFPFYIVQLANWGGVSPDPIQDQTGFFDIREAQFQISQSVPNTGLAVAIDIGGENIHPPNKREVGRRLALLALNRSYGKKQIDSGPVYDGLTVKDNKVSLKFTQTGDGLIAKDGSLKQFSIASSDHHFIWADAVIEGNSVVVSSPSVPSPVAVRYAWSNNPSDCNLYNSAGLPASPFRTDNWNPALIPSTH